MFLAEYDNIEYLDSTLDLTAYEGQDIFVAYYIPPGGLDGWRLFLDDICIVECVPNAGPDETTDVCRADGEVDLDSTITPVSTTVGNWNFEANPFLLDSIILDFTTLPVGAYELEYVIQAGCANDTVISIVNVFDTPNAGTDGTITVCQNQPFDLLSGLSGTVDLGGTWIDQDGNELSNSSTNAGSEAGTFTFTYTASNPACDDVTTDVTVEVTDCDFLSIDEENTTEISVYPNPTTGLVSLNINNINTAFNYKVIDITGRAIVSEFNVSSQNTQIDLNNQENGIYMIHVFNENIEKTIQIVKK